MGKEGSGGEGALLTLLTFFNLFSREIRAAFRRTCYHICEADAETQELVIVVGCQWFGRETAQV